MGSLKGRRKAVATGKDRSRSRTGATRRADIPPEILHALTAGTLETATLAEGLAIDFAALFSVIAPDLAESAAQRLPPALGITQRMAAAGALMIEHWSWPEIVSRWGNHPSDTVRGWCAYALAAVEMSLPQRLEAILSFARDSHFAVREWAWLATRPAIAGDLPLALSLLQSWVASSDANQRRFAIEITRPRGVWCSHLPLLKDSPQLGEPLLSAVRADPSKYVRDSAANWLNDAGKSRPDWLLELCQRWQSEHPENPQTSYILRRGQRSLS